MEGSQLDTQSEMQSLTTDVVIVGAGPVGLFASFQAGLLGMRSIVLDPLDEPGGQLTYLYPNKYVYDIPGYPQITAKDLVWQLLLQASQYNPQLMMGHSAQTLVKSAQGFTVTTSGGATITCKSVIIAAGAGSFKPQKLALQHADVLEGKSLFYSVSNPEQFRNKRVVIVGGGDSAVDWALHLSEDNLAEKVYLVHRRANFRAMPGSLALLEDRVQTGRLELVTPYITKELVRQGDKLASVVLEHFANKEKRLIDADSLLAFFGLTRSLGSLEQWGLNINAVHSTITVEPGTYETNIEGVFAVGDIADYPHKLKLIMLGFSEVAKALHYAWKYVFPDKPFRFTHSTSSRAKSP